jgi:chemotaxis protein CheD
MTPHRNASGVVFLKPGEMVMTAEPTVVTTLLGSCVAVTMFSPRHRLGAICHALLPTCRSHHCTQWETESGKYVECAIRSMLEGFVARGVAKSEIEVKLFGGSEMFDIAEGKHQSVGRQNAQMALSMLEGEPVRLVKQDLGGQRGRKIIFHTATGEVFLKRLRKSEI